MTRTVNTVALEMERTFSADPATVFRAWSEPDAVRAWMGPSDDLEVTMHRWDCRTGGDYRIEMNNPEGGSRHVVGGRFLTVDPPATLVFTWVWEDEPDMVTQVTVELTGVEQGTCLKLHHEGFVDGDARSRHEQGWSGTFNRLTRHLA